jgi:ATP-binding cassette subfamily A (ABC1) protein 3
MGAILVQYGALIVKALHLKKREKIRSVIELLVPAVFTLLLAIGYWLASDPSADATTYANGDVWYLDDLVTALPESAKKNFSEAPEYFLCQREMEGYARDTTFITCPTDRPGLKCLNDNMPDICFNDTTRYIMDFVIQGLIEVVPGSLVPYGMSAFLALARWVYLEHANWANIGAHSPSNSLFHSGYLILVGAQDVTNSFRTYCKSRSELCGRVLYPTNMASSDDAAHYTYDNGAAVWAVLDLTDFDTASGNLDYTIRMNFTSTPYTFSALNQYTQGRGPRNDLMYLNSGFLTLQTMVNEFGITLMNPNASVLELLQSSAVGSLTNVGSCPMPTRGYATNDFLLRSGHFVPLVMTFGFLYALSRLLSMVVEEKENRIKEAMFIMGLRPFAFYSSWLTITFVSNVIACLLCALAGKLTFFNHVDYFLLFVVNLCFANTISAMGFVLSAIFSRSRVAALVGPLLLFITTVPHYAIPANTALSIWYAVSLLPCTAYAQAINRFTMLATNGVDANWKVLFEGEYSIAAAIGFMLLDWGIYLLLALYLDLVVPGEFGRPKHPLFFLPECMQCGLPRFRVRAYSERPTPPSAMIEDEEPLMSDAGVDEAERDGADYLASTQRTTGGGPAPYWTRVSAIRRKAPTVRLLDLCKRYDTATDDQQPYAVNGLTLDIHQDEILVLLGHNGAGKSTTMHMITGMTRPTGGDITINGYSIHENLLECRSSIGFCPQHNVLWPNLSVVDHLTFFAVIKAHLSRRKARLEALRYAALVGLEPNVVVRALSGGQKRKLSVAIALIGESPLVLLDEPTAGMDANARRDMWEMLMERRKGRSILLSTHYMDEADLLGDRIAIMDHGNLHSIGSSLFLKSRLGTGYTLHLLVQQDADEAALLRFVQTKCPAARLKDDEDATSNQSFDRRQVSTPRISSSARLAHSKPGSPTHHRDIEVWLPNNFVDEDETAQALFLALEANGPSVGIVSYGLALTTLEDIFVGIAERGSAAALASQAAAAGTTVAEEDLPPTAPLIVDPHGSDGDRSFGRHCRAMLIKRYHCAKRDRKALCFQIVLPVIFMGIALLLMLLRPPAQPALRIDSHMYPAYGSEVLYRGLNATPDFTPIARNFTSAYHLTAVNSVADDEDPAKGISSVLLRDLMNHSEDRWFAVANRQPAVPWYVDLAAQSTTVLFNVTAPHSIPQALNALASAASNALIHGAEAARTVHFTVTNHPLPLSKFEKEVVTAIMQIVSALFVLIPFTFIPAQFVSFTVRERETKAKHLQWVSGANTAAYWVSTILADLFAFLVTELLAIIIFLIFRRHEFVGDWETFAATFCLFFFYGLSMVPLSCLLSFAFDRHGPAQNMVMLGNFFFGFLLVLAAQILAAIDSTRQVNLYLCYVYRLVPSYCLGEGIIALTARDMTALLLNGDKPSAFAMIKFENEYGGFIGGVGTSLAYMGAMAPFFFLALFVMERWKIAKYRLQLRAAAAFAASGDTKALATDTSGSLNGGNEEDEDVARERQEVEKGAGRPQDCLTVQRLKKVFTTRDPPKVAVDEVSFGVHRGEIFAFLGTNGAGKTTTMSILTGDLVQTSGRAFVAGHDVSAEPGLARMCLGYCPQFDALHGEMTPTEHMYLYSRLKGVPEKAIQRSADHLLKALGVHAYKDKPARALSGGNKRKLSIAIALVGNPSVVLLDEPSAGMDPMARRVLWTELEAIARSRSVVLTTHHLEEVEALADRAAIMVAGKLRCIGSLQHLKSKFGGGTYEVEVKTSNEEELKDFSGAAAREIQATVLETHGNQGHFSVAQVPLSQLFAFVARQRRLLNIVHYAVNQASIEQVFIRISAENEDVDSETRS